MSGSVIRATIPYVKADIPILVLFRALGTVVSAGSSSTTIQANSTAQFSSSSTVHRLSQRHRLGQQLVQIMS